MALLGAETSTFLTGGRALLVGSVADDGTPWAGRGWGLDLVDTDRGLIRLLCSAADLSPDSARAGAAVAVTATSIRTLRSLQLKGRVTGVGPTGHGDDELHRRYCEQMFSDIRDTDGTPPEVVARLVPRDLLAVAVQVDEVFDQTPGPGAGAPVAGATP